MGITQPTSPKDPWPDPPELPEKSDTALAVRRWRWKAFRAAGVTFAEADLLADGDADLATLRRLVAKGCAPDLIVKILL